MVVKPYSVTITTTMILLLPFPPSPQDCTKELEKYMSFEALKNSQVHVQEIKEPFSHLS